MSSNGNNDNGGLVTGFLLFTLVPLVVMQWRQRRQLQLQLQLPQKPALKVVDETLTPQPDKPVVVPPPSPSKEVTDPFPYNQIPPALLQPTSRQVSLDTSDPMEQTEILLHNISHADMIMSLAEDDTIIARPTFSSFRGLSETMYNAIKELSTVQLVKYPVHSRNSTLPKRPIIRTTSEVSDVVPVGFDFKELANSDLLALDNLDQLRFRQNDKEKLSKNPDIKHTISAAFFPLLAALIPKWESYILERRGKWIRNTKLVVFLISGQGTARDETANVVDNSTDICAHLMKVFLQEAYPYIEVRLLPSPGLNLFRYDENIQFVKQILLPPVEDIRSTIVASVQDKWKEYMHIYISYASGSSARVSAIGASLRPYRWVEYVIGGGGWRVLLLLPLLLHL